MKSKISLLKSKSHYKGVKGSLTSFREDIKKRISNLSSIVIKINLVITRTPAYNKGVELATTPFDAVRSFIDFILPFYKGKIIIAEEAAWGDTKEGFKMYGFSKLAKQNPQIKLLDLKDDETIIQKIIYPGGVLELPFSKTLIQTPFLVSIVRPKTHCTVCITASVKNVLVGAIQKYSMKRKVHRGKYIHNIMTSIADLVYPDFVVIDGTIGMESGGPVRGKEIKSGWILSSFDATAADSLAVYLMGFNVNDIGYLILLKEKGIGLSYPNNKIEIIGEKPKDLVFPFKPHRSFKKTRLWKQ
jgi:uncharacterized protein (DUF362 family)